MNLNLFALGALLLSKTINKTEPRGTPRGLVALRPQTLITVKLLF